MNYKGLPVVDATEPLTMRVTDSDIDNAVRGDVQHCVLANAVSRQKAVKQVVMKRSCALVRFTHRPDEFVRYVLSLKSRAMIRRFDAGKDGFGTGKVNLLPPYPSDRLGAREATRRHLDGTQAPRRKSVVVERSYRSDATVEV